VRRLWGRFWIKEVLGAVLDGEGAWSGAGLEESCSHGRFVGGEISQGGIQGEKEEGTGGDSI
jgi:hypothetical protein